MNLKKFLKTLTTISLIMITIYFGSLIYQFITKASPLAKVIKITDIVMFLVFIFTLKKQAIISPFIGIIIAVINIVISLIYFDVLTIFISGVFIYECYKLILAFQDAKRLPSPLFKKKKKSV